MRLHRGAIQTQDFVNYPIYELNAAYLPQMYNFTSSAGGLSINYSGFNTGTNLLNLFPANIPRKVTDNGSIIQHDFKYSFNSAVGHYIVETMQLESVDIGVKPTDFDSHFMDYYTLRQVTANNNTYTVYVPVNNGTVNVPTWSATESYYHDILSAKKHITQMFCTAQNATFGLSLNCQDFASNVGTRALKICRNANQPSGDTTIAASAAKCNNSGFSGIMATIGGFGYMTQQTESVTDPQRTLFIFVHVVYSGIDYYGIAILLMSDNTDNAVPTNARCTLFSANFWGDSVKAGDVPGIGKWGDDSTVGGGNGTFTAVSNNRGDASGTGIATLANNAGTLINAKAAATFLNIYHVSTADMVELTSVLFSADYFDKFRQSMYNPLSAVLSCHLLPMGFIPVTPLSQRHYTAGGYDLSSDMTIPTTNGDIIGSIQSMHVGSIDISAYFDAFPDYAPYTKCTLHLPYIGAVDIDINSIVGGKLAVDYICDVVSGNVAAWVYCQDESGTHTYKYVGTGNCAYNIPLIAENQSGVAVGKALMSAVSGAVSLAAGNVGGISGIASGVVGGLTASHAAQISGNLSGNMGAICDPTCWLEIERPIWVNPSTYKQLHGIPSQIGGTIASNECTGFLAVESIELTGLSCTDAEKQQLYTILRNGIQILEG